MQLTIPTSVVIESRLLTWTASESATEKSVAVEVNPDAHIRIVGVRSNLPAVTATLVTDTPDRRYHVVIKPEARWRRPRDRAHRYRDRCGTECLFDLRTRAVIDRAPATGVAVHA